LETDWNEIAGMGARDFTGPLLFQGAAGKRPAMP